MKKELTKEEINLIIRDGIKNKLKHKKTFLDYLLEVIDLAYLLLTFVGLALLAALVAFMAYGFYKLF